MKNVKSKKSFLCCIVNKKSRKDEVLEPFCRGPRCLPVHATWSTNLLCNTSQSNFDFWISSIDWVRNSICIDSGKSFSTVLYLYVIMTWQARHTEYNVFGSVCPSNFLAALALCWKIYLDSAHILTPEWALVFTPERTHVSPQNWRCFNCKILIDPCFHPRMKHFFHPELTLKIKPYVQAGMDPCFQTRTDPCFKFHPRSGLCFHLRTDLCCDPRMELSFYPRMS